MGRPKFKLVYIPFKFNFGPAHWSPCKSPAQLKETSSAMNSQGSVHDEVQPGALRNALKRIGLEECGTLKGSFVIGSVRGAI